MRLIAETVTCVRGGRELFRDLAFTVAGGEALAVTGPNGAGKSSLLRLIAGFLRPVRGRFTLETGDPERTAGASIHFVGHLDGISATLSVRENLVFAHAMLGGDGQSEAAALEAMGLGHVAELPAHMLSAGQRRRLALARLIAVWRPVWLLDEPTTALDTAGQETFARIAEAHLRRGGLIVAATHMPLKIQGLRELRLGAGGRDG